MAEQGAIFPHISAPREPINQPSSKAKASPPTKQDPNAPAPTLDLPPDVFAAWQAFTDALGTHAPRAYTRVQELGKGMHQAVA